MALSSNGLGRDPLKVEIRVRFPLRLLPPTACTHFFDSGCFKRKNPQESSAFQLHEVLHRG